MNVDFLNTYWFNWQIRIWRTFTTRLRTKIWTYFKLRFFRFIFWNWNFFYLLANNAAAFLLFYLSPYFFSNHLNQVHLSLAAFLIRSFQPSCFSFCHFSFFSSVCPINVSNGGALDSLINGALYSLVQPYLHVSRNSTLL